MKQSSLQNINIQNKENQLPDVIILLVINYSLIVKLSAYEREAVKFWAINVL